MYSKERVHKLLLKVDKNLKEELRQAKSKEERIEILARYGVAMSRKNDDSSAQSCVPQ